MLPPVEGMPQDVLPEGATGRSGPYRDGYDNPEDTSPAPPPNAAKRPEGYWESPAEIVSWATQGNGLRGVWGSSLYDLRTDLRGVASRELGGQPVNRMAALQMWIAIQGLTNPHLGLQVLMAHWGHPVDYAKAAQFTAWSNVTADVSTGLDLAILDFWPPGSGYQMRHWQVRLRFDFRLAPALAPPVLQVQAGVY